MLYTIAESCKVTAAQNYTLGRIFTVVSRLLSFLIKLFYAQSIDKISMHSLASIAGIIVQAN